MEKRKLSQGAKIFLAILHLLAPAPLAFANGAGTYQVAVYGGNANGYGDFKTLVVSIANPGGTPVEGLRWARRFLPGGGSLHELEFGNGWYLGGRYWSERKEVNLYRTQNGLIWETVKVADGTRLVELAHNAGEWIALTSNGTVFRSVNNGESWTTSGKIPLPLPGFTGSADDSSEQEFDGALVGSLVFCNGSWVFAAGNSIYRSADSGSSWTSESAGSPFNLKDMAVGNGVLVAVGEGGEILTSPDGGMAWSRSHSGTNRTLNSVAFGGGRFVAVGGDGVVLTSTDNGATWVSQASGTNNWFSAVQFGNGVFVRSDGYASADGVAWSSPQSGWAWANYDDGLAFGSAGWILGG